MPGQEGIGNELIFNSDSSGIYMFALRRSIHWYKLLEGSFGNISKLKGHRLSEPAIPVIILYTQKYSHKCERFMNKYFYFNMWVIKNGNKLNVYL